jgi:5-hydroxyisourate hydrolase-like protein (transthyretin family)
MAVMLAGIAAGVSYMPTLAQQSDSASVRVVPSSGEQGETHTILASGLEPGQQVTVEIIRDETGNEVYSSTRNASDNGRLELEIFTTDDDPPGDYTINVLSGEETLGTTTLTIEEPQGFNASVSITPEVAPAGSTHTINITEVRQFLDMRVLVRDEASQVVYESRVRATVDGTVSVSYTSAPDAQGEYTVAVVTDEGNQELGSTTVTIEAITDDVPGSLSIDPATVGQDARFDVAVSGLEADTEFTVEIVQNATGDIIYSTERTTDDSGEFLLQLSTGRDDVPGQYTVRMIQDNTVAAAATLTITDSADAEAPADEQAAQPDEPPAAEASLEVVPESVNAGDTVFISGAGFTPDAAVMINARNAQNEVIDERSVNADSNGTFLYNLQLPDDAVSGEYTVTALLDNRAIAQDTFDVSGVDPVQPTATPTPEATPEPTDAPDTEASLEVMPAAGPRGTTHQITAQGLPADSTVTLRVLFEGDEVYSTELTTDRNGATGISLISEETDPIGVYSVEIVQDGDTLVTGELAITEGDDSAQPDPTDEPTEDPTPEAELTDEPEAVFDEVTVTVVPESAARGSAHTVRVEGLVPNEQVTLDVQFDGETVFETERTADPTGTIELMLESTPDDEFGTYTVRVLRDAEAIATADFDVLDDDAEPEATPAPQDVSIDVQPDSGDIGTDYTFTITGLQPDETVTLNVLFDDEVVFETSRAADPSGTIEITLTTEEGDPPGQYIMNVLRDDDVIASTTFEATADVTEGTETEVPATPAPSEVTINVEPESGPVGTTHVVTFSGLTNGITYSVDVLFDGEVVFNTERTADASGRAILNLASETGDSPGVYTVRITRDGETLATADFTVEGDSAEATPPPEATPAPTIAPPQVLESSGVFTDRLTTDAPSDRYSFEGTEGENVVISVTSPDFDSYLTLVDENGVTLAENDDVDETLNSRIGPFRLPYSGTYTVIVTSFSYHNSATPEFGAYRLLVERISTGSIDYGQTQTLTFDDSTFGSYLTFDANVGDVLSATVAGDGIDTQLRLLGPDGDVLVTDDDSGAGVNPELQTYTATVTGTYTLAITAFTPGAAGSADVTLTRTEQRTLAEGTLSIRLDSKQPAETLVLDAVSGEEIQLEMAVTSGIPNDLVVQATQGDEVLMDYRTTRGIPQTLTLGFVVPNDGTVTITIGDASGAVSTLDVSISRTLPE